MASRPGRFAPRERAPGIHWIGGWADPRAGLDAVLREKFPPPAGTRKPHHSSRSPLLYLLHTGTAISEHYKLRNSYCVIFLILLLIHLRYVSTTPIMTGF